MNEEQSKLEALQRIDISIIEVEEEIGGLQRQITELENGCKEKQELIEQKQQALKQNETKRSDLEKMLFLEQDRLKRTRNKLQGTGIRNPHAFNANQREIDKVKKDIESFEAELLKIMEEVENNRAAIEKLEKETDEIKQSLEGSRKESDERSGELTAKRDKLVVEREKIVAEIDPSTMNLYKRIQGRYPRNAVVRAKDESCMGCHMNIPPQLYNEIQRGDKLISCPACHRILFFYTQTEAEMNSEAASG